MEQDLEKSSAGNTPVGEAIHTDAEELGSSTTGTTFSSAKQWLYHFESVTGIESRGIQRVQPEERYESSFVQMLLLWLSANLTANNTVVGLLGPLVFELGFTDAALCAVFGGLLGSCGVAYMGTWGPRSGNRTLV
jgi:hypothetical protein